MNKRAAHRLNDVALNILDLVHCLHTGAANEISFESWKDMFARGKEYEAARKQWQRWKADLEEHGICERFAEGREDRIILKANAADTAEALHDQAQAVLTRGKVERRYPDQVTIAGRTYFLKVYGRAVRPLTDREYAALRESILAERRIEVPVIVDPKGNVVDGKHRLIIAVELGLEDVPIIVLEGERPEVLHRLAEDLNACRRQFTRQQLAELARQRQERARQKRAAGMSYRQIAEDERVSIAQIQRDLGPEVEAEDATVLGKDGRQQPARKLDAAETAERRQRVAELHRDGEMTPAKIADELGVSVRTVQRDIEAMAAAEAEAPKPESPPYGYGIVVHMAQVGEKSWLGVDREADPLETCLEAALSCIDQLRTRVEDPELVKLATTAHEVVESVLWRLLEGAGA